MRIVHVVTRSNRRGAEVVAVELADALDKLGHHDQLVALVLAFDGDKNPRLDPLVESASIDLVTQVRAGWRLRRMLDARPADVVIAHGGWAARVCAVALRERHGRRVWQRILDFPERTWHGARLLYWRLIARRFDAAIVLSAALEDEMRRLRFRGPVWTIPNARDPARFEDLDRDSAAAQLRAELGVPAGEHVVGFVGHLVPQKQPALAVDMVASLRSRGCLAHLVVAGDGPLRASVAHRVDDLALSSHVTLMGHRDDVERVYAAIDLLVITSASEGVPGIAIEAQMAGCPIVSFPVGSITDVVDDGVTGLVVERPDVEMLAHAVARLLQDPARLLTMGARGREHSAEYSTTKTAVMYDKRLNSLGDGATRG